MGYNKKILSQATAGLNKVKAPKKQQDIIVDPKGQWAHPGQPTRIPGNNITMQGVPYPVYGIDNTGFAQMMYPGQDYQFQGDYVDEYPMMKKGGSLPKKKNSKGYSKSLSATNKIFVQNPITKKNKSKKKKVFDPNAKYYQDGGFKEESRLKEKMLSRYPGFKKSLGTEGENLHIIADPNFKAGEHGYGDIEVMFPGTDKIAYTPEYTYASPFPGEYVIPYNPDSNINKGDIFLDMLHLLQNDEEVQPYYEMFKKAALDSRGEDLMWQWEEEKQNPNFVNALESSGTDAFGQYEKNYIDGLLRSELARKGMGRRTTDKGYKLERSVNSPEMRKAANEIYKYLKRKQTGGDISIPELTEFQEGGVTCPPGQKPDGKGGCILIGEVEVEEQVIYGDPAKDKQQTSLMNQLRQAKGAYQDWREEAGLRKAQLNNEGATSIEGLKRQIADYKKELAEEKKAYDKAGKALNVLKKQRPDEWKNAKLADVMSGKGIEALRSLYSEEKISDQTFRDFYNTFGKEFDTNVVEGRGPGAQYSAREARENWMENVPEFVENVGNFAKAAALTPAMLALAPTAPLINAGSAGARLASPFMQVLRTAWRNPMIKALPGSSARNAISSYYLADTLMDTPEVLSSIGQGFTGEKEWSDVAAETGMYAFDLATAGATKNIGAGIKALKPEAQAVTKFLDRPFSTYGKKMNLVRAISDSPSYQKFENFTRGRYPKFLGEVRSLNKMTPADLLKANTVGSTLWNSPETIRNITDDSYLLADSNLSPEERLLAAGRIGRNTVMTGLGALPILRKTAPLYSRNWANKIFLADNLLKGIVYQDPTSARALFNASRIIAKQEGGQTNSYTDYLSQKKIDELIKQGYNIEYLD